MFRPVGKTWLAGIAQMRACERKTESWQADDLGVLPEAWEVALVTRQPY